MIDRITKGSIITVGEDVVSCNLAGGAALLDLRSRTYFSLNSVGTQIWGLLQGPVSVSDIHNALITQYDVEPAECYSDLTELLGELADAGLVRIGNAAGR